MSRRRLALLLLLASGAAAASAQQPAAVRQWRVNFAVSWGGTAPSRVTLQTPATGGIEFPATAQPVLVDQAVAGGLADYRLVVHFPEVSHDFSVLARSGQPAYRLRLTLPQGLQCDNPLVSRIGQDARSGEPERLANAGLSANYLLARRSNRCSQYNVTRLREAMFQSHCRLAARTDAFFVPELPWPEFSRRVEQCRSGIRVAAITRRFEQAGSEAQQRDYAALDVSLAELQALLQSPEWRPAFALARLDQDNLRHLEVESLYNRAVPLRDAGNLTGAAPFAARLAELASRRDYLTAFGRADLAPAAARDIDRRIQEALERPPEPAPEPDQQ